jgi:hypothetical protein
MNYRNELHEVITTVPTFAEHHTFTNDLPEGFMIEQDGNKFYPRYFKSENTERSRPGYFYFYQGHSTIKFTTFDEAKSFITSWVAFLEQLSGFAAPVQEEETYEDMLAAQYNERLLNEVVYYTENVDRSERVARLVRASRDGVLLADPADSTDQGCWYSFSQVSNIQRGRQYGWK